ARWWVGGSSRIGGMRCSTTAPRLPNPPRRTTRAMGAEGSSGTEVHGPEGDRRPSPAGREGETLQPPRILVNARQHRASLFSEPKDLLPSPGLLPTSVAVAALVRTGVRGEQGQGLGRSVATS